MIRKLKLHRLNFCSTLCDVAHTLPEQKQMLLHLITSGIGGLNEMEDNLECSGIRVSHGLVAQLFNSCIMYQGKDNHDINISRRLYRFFSWYRQKNPQGIRDEAFNHAIQAFARMKDSTAMNLAICDLQKDGKMMTPETFSLVVKTLVWLQKEDEAIRLYRSLERKQLLETNCEDGDDIGKGNSCIIALVHSLCAKGHAGKARGAIWSLKRNLLTDGGPVSNVIHRCLLHGWCVRGNAREAHRTLNEMRSVGIQPGTESYNDLLYCICNRNAKFNPSALVPEATNIMTQMKLIDAHPTVFSFNILLYFLGRVRRVKEAFRVLYLMQQGKMECSPDCTSYFIVIRVMYLTSRFVRGNLLVEDMLKKGLLPGTSFYHRLIGILCGLEKVNHALKIFELMNAHCSESYGPTYDLLIGKHGRSGNFYMAKCLWDEAVSRGIVLNCSRDQLDPSRTEVFKPRTARIRSSRSR